MSGSPGMDLFVFLMLWGHTAPQASNLFSATSSLSSKLQVQHKTELSPWISKPGAGISLFVTWLSTKSLTGPFLIATTKFQSRLLAHRWHREGNTRSELNSITTFINNRLSVRI